jgi:hypothetical protein
MMAYKFIRLIARLDEPTKPHYAKKLREKYLYVPAKVTKHARQIFLRIPKIFQKEASLMQSRWAGNTRKAKTMKLALRTRHFSERL